MTLTYNPSSGTSDLGVRNCAPQIGYRGRILLHIEDKSIEAEEVCHKVMGAETCLSPKKVVDRETGEVVWENGECREADDYDGCWAALFARYRGLLAESESLESKVGFPRPLPHPQATPRLSTPITHQLLWCGVASHPAKAVTASNGVRRSEIGQALI